MTDYRENIDTNSENLVTEQVSDSTESVEAADAAQRATADTAARVQQTQVDDDIVTAVLLIRNRSGAVLPVTSLENLKMDHQANAHEVFRMCADVQDQISAVRIVGELAQIFDHINSRSLKQVAELLGVKMNANIKQAQS